MLSLDTESKKINRELSHSNNSDKISTESKQNRESNFELLRIVSMMIIIAYHTFRYIDTDAFNHWQMAAYHAVRWYGLLGVNCYLLISSHFLIGRRSHPKKLLPLIVETLFYSVFFLLCRIIYAYASKTDSHLWKDLRNEEIDALFQPFWADRYWFVTAYLSLYLLLPFLNLIIQRLSAKHYKLLIQSATLILFFYQSFPQNDNNPSVILNTIWFSYVYLLAGYLKIYRPDNWIRSHAGLIFFALWLLFIQSKMWLTYDIQNDHLYYFVEHTTGNSLRYSFIQLLMALCLFYMFQRIHFKSRLVNRISSCTFGIYLFHENKVFHLCEFLVEKMYSAFIHLVPSLALFMLCLVIGQFLAGTIFDLLRQRLFLALRRQNIR